jgi:hypothetical protein
MMLAERDDSASLRPAGALTILNDKAHLRSRFESVIPVADDGVAMEVNFVARRRDDKATVSVGKEAAYLAVIGHGVQLHFAPGAPDVIFKPPAQRIEGIAHRNVYVLMGMVQSSLVSDCYLLARNDKVYANVEQIALPVMMVLRLDDDAACGDAVAKLLQLLGPPTNARLKRGRGFHLTEGDLQRHLHRKSPLSPRHGHVR